MGALDPVSGTHEGALTCLPDKHLLRWAQGSLTHGVVHTHTDLITSVLAQIYGGEWRSGTQRLQSQRLELQGGGGGTDTILVPHVTMGRKQVASLRCLGCTLPTRICDTKHPSALGS